MAIRREDNTVWERRAPLSPNHVRQLVRAGVNVIIQPSNRRAFAMQVSQLVHACSLFYVICVGEAQLVTVVSFKLVWKSLKRLYLKGNWINSSQSFSIL